MAGDFNEPQGAGAFRDLVKRLERLRNDFSQIERQFAQEQRARERGVTPSREADERAVQRGRRAPGEGRGRLLREEGAVEGRATSAVDAHAKALEKLESTGRRQVQIQRVSNTALQRDIQANALASQELTRRGALTTEFFSAAAAGNVTLREMRSQLGLTIAKFGGWTLAAGLVFGVVGAFQQLGAGAINGLHSVNQLQRVISNLDVGRAHQQIRELSHDLNLPVETVGEGFFEAAKVYQNQQDAFRVTQVGLKATKIADLSAADSVRFLTATIRGFREEAGASVNVLDELNQMQNRFGIGTRDTAEGVAKAAAAFRNAGAEGQRGRQVLEAIVGTITRGGYTGAEAGTAVRRSAEIIQRSPQRREELRGFGLDPDKRIDDLYLQAFQLVRSRRVQGKDITRLATALSTPQLSSRFASALNRPDLFARVLDQVQHHAAGSADRELNRTLKSAREQIARIGIELQQLGDALAQAGFLDIFGVFLKLLNSSLHLTSELVGLFAQLPRPIREALIVAAQLYGTLRLIRRFNPIEPGQGGRFGGFFRQTESRNTRSLLRQAAGSDVKFFRDEQERLARVTAQRSFESNIAANAAVSTRGQNLAAAQGGDVEALRRIQRAESESARAYDEALRSKTAYIAANQRLTGALKTQGDIDQRLRREAPSAVAAAYGIKTIPGTTQRPTHIPPQNVEQVTEGGLVVPPGVGYAAQPVEEVTRKSRQITQDLRRVGSQGTLLERASGSLGVGAAAAGRQLSRVPGALNRVPGAIGGAAARFRGLGREFFSLFGPFELLIIDALLFTAALDQFKQDKKLDDALQKAPKSVKDAGDKLKQARSGGFLGIHHAQDAFSNLLGREGARQARIGAAEAEQREAEVNRRAREAAARRRARSLGRGRLDAFAGLDPAGINKELENIETQAGLYGADDSLVRGATTGYLELATRIAGSHKQDDIKKLAEARGHFDSVLKDIQSDLERSLTLATTPGQRRQAYSTAFGSINKVREQARRERQKVRLDLQHTKDRESGAQAALDRYDASQATSAFGGTLATGEILGRDERNRLVKNLSRLRTNRKHSQAQLKALNKEQHEIELRLRELELEIRVERFDTETARLQSVSEVRTSAIRDPLEKAAIGLQLARRNVQRALRSGFQNTRQGQQKIREARIAYNQAVQEQQDAVVSQIDASNQISEAQAPTEQARLAQSINHLQSKIALFRSQGRGKDEIASLVADLINARKQLHQQAIEDAQSLIEAQADYAKSLTASPVREAQIDLRSANRNLVQARRVEDPTQRRVQTLQALSRRNQARGALRLSRLQERLDTFDYRATIGDYSPDQQIEGLTRIMRSIPDRLLKTVDGLRDFKRQLATRIHQLRKEAEDPGAFELNVGNVRLPSLYEIRRQVANQRSGGSIRMEQRNNVNVTVNDPGAASAVFDAIDKATNTGVRAAGRAAGVL